MSIHCLWQKIILGSSIAMTTLKPSCHHSLIPELLESSQGFLHPLALTLGWRCSKNPAQSKDFFFVLSLKVMCENRAIAISFETWSR